MIATRVALVLSVWLCCATAFAHERSVSYSSWTAGDEGLEARVSMSAREAERLFDAAPLASVVDAGALQLARELGASRGGVPCTVVPSSAGRRAADAGMLAWGFRLWCRGRGTIRIESTLLAREAPHHVHFLQLRDARSGQTFEHVLSDGARDVSLDLEAPSAPSGFSNYVRLGVEHIVTGYDHLAFLLLLLLPVRRLKTLFGVITGFSIGHSLTLALAAFGVVHANPRWVEACVAASIVVAAVDAVWSRSASFSAGLASGFGLVHGLAFASVLAELSLERGALASALFGFNVGVELGQLAIALFAFGAFGLLRKRSEAHALALRQYASGAVAAGAIVLCASRIAGS